MTGPEHLVVLITTPSVEVGAMLAHNLVSSGLAACCNIVPQVRSIYLWEGVVRDEPEALLLVKTRVDRYEALEERVRSLHPYSVPEVLALPVVRGHKVYLNWVSHAVDRITPELGATGHSSQ